ncbi:signal transduction histidine kinase [Rhizomicrobium palustre]|uniref:histidine kinase n=1 Tax=Rhizomicrobium palustre TaxID=189966 RepID=A0A846MX80_9PROT|nr:signal transduction histidine kinase [Rhizomicrobium palustre]
MAHSLSGRLLLLTILYVLISGALIFLPAMGIAERDILENHILSAELTILPFTTPGQSWPEALRQELLTHANADEVLLRRPYQRDYFQVGALHSKIDRTIDITKAPLWAYTANALECLLRGGGRTLHVIAPTNIKDAQSISIILSESHIRAELITSARRVVWAAAFISCLTGLLVYLSLYYVVVAPVRRFTKAMAYFHANPEDASRILAPSTRADEIGLAERELSAMQKDLYGFLRQKERLAALGTAVSRIQHDLRNILANAQLASDRLTASADPEVKRLAPRLITAIDRAIQLATSTLKYGKAEDHPPVLSLFCLCALMDEIAATMEGRHGYSFANRIAPGTMAKADRDQLYRIILNLLRNACEAAGETGNVEVRASNLESVLAIDIADSGPGIAASLREKLFQPFVTSGRPGGSGLGLSIARDLARAHGGDVVLLASGPQGTVFRVTLPA